MAKNRTGNIAALMPSMDKNTVGKTIKTIKSTRTTINLDPDDEEEIDRISAELRNRGYRVKESTKIIRLALRLAFRDLNEKELDQVNYDLAEKWKQGSTGGKTTKTT